MTTPNLDYARSMCVDVEDMSFWSLASRRPPPPLPYRVWVSWHLAQSVRGCHAARLRMILDLPTKAEAVEMADLIAATTPTETELSDLGFASWAELSRKDTP